MSAPIGRYFEDFAVGDRFTTPARTVTEADVVGFAGLSGDYNPLHTDEEMASQTQFGGRIAHGLLGLAVASGLVARTGLFDGTALAFLGIEDWRFRAPIRLGDTIRVEVEIKLLRRTSGGVGLVGRGMRIINGDGVVVQEGTFNLLVESRNRSGDHPE